MPTEASGGNVAIVGIGASAGGVEAFRGFFENMPPDTGMGFVVILHLPVDRKSLLPEILRRWTSMKVIEAVDNCRVESNCVYVPPSGVAVTLTDGHLRLHNGKSDEAREPAPIDIFFNSLAIARGEDAVGIVLSGMGSDGALGLKAIKTCGGLTLAQGIDGTGPQHASMPSSAIAAGAVDIIASVEAMPRHIIEMRNRPLPLQAAVSAEHSDNARLAICAALHRQIGHDFSGYKTKTFMRRVQRRMQVLNLPRLDAYIARLESDRAEVTMLFNDLLIGVTAFFRDVETFAALKETVIPRLFDGQGADGHIRVWVPGCATGEEAYSLAILLREHMDDLRDAAPTVQIFASDIDESAVTTARTGRYPSTLLKDISAERLARFFVRGNDGSYIVAKQVRELCTFSAHSLIRDPPFSRINLVSCRNLLIYLDSDLQSVAITAFHYSLVPKGILLLGSSETISRHENLFRTVDRPHKIFERRDVASPALQLTGKNGHRPMQFKAGAIVTTLGVVRPGLTKIANRGTARILERYAPVSAVVSADGEIVQFSSRAGRFLEPAAGLPNQNVAAMARPGLRLHLRRALKQAIETGHAVDKRRVPVDIAGEGRQLIRLVVEPINEPGFDPHYLVVFIEGDTQKLDAAGQFSSDAGGDGGSISHLETELRDTREQLQSITEEHETALEELKSSNEELLSVNEELQSTNEEMETSKEEIQSMNEELQTLNSQLSAKVDELDLRNTDLRNLFESTQVATIFLDSYLVIRNFTPAVASIYNLIPSDQGRPITDIVSRLGYGDLRQDVSQVLKTLKPLERRVTRADGSAHYLMRILPYRNPDSTVDGTLVTFVDVTSIVHAEQHQRLLVDELNHRVKNMLTVVISLATQSMRRAKTMEEFSESYFGRLKALTAAYSLLSDDRWQTVSLRSLITEELKPFMTDDRSNVVLSGPEVLLEPRASLALGMALHELTTNAVKYGAFSVPEGKVSINWRLEGKTPDLALDWVETGGPPVAAPTHKGFGMTLIERGLRQDMSADVTIDFAAEGVIAKLRAPLKANKAAETPNEGTA